ncbi:trna modification gtpase : Small GTP-binding protein domain protein OS=Singulisphaera acidiphila (strain ATCC BAA-1392 / DSM 18658 / VKM B-2454 / MOB10) GN=Sinac_6522 PE=4 SV=1: MMR_HSR1 [Gemmata massiliana]|uniref:G domain-containing protein n=1 Tax=Gemmata massiliana TaxID=1210884 RepID=A0A6P2DDT1_9BACT|nr:GTPase [Gemmata massiliana]VTR97572.1 trna modification gtpase : Small GTP-binding protein domain protein OS=Singulisphaera acidiphila (strain ATCC BAA-1392 / DSM 18658 / VKM B-2454 / MOB10) GN=Sinac_6522 PE=4 SV=1: MMR_HSR1 [Gemmata massiliana]
MSDTVVSPLTPPGAGAIATVEVRGPRAWELARQLFRPAGKPLPEAPEVNRFWFGTLGSDEVVLAVTGPLPCGRGSSIASANEPRPQGSGPATTTIEVHCHGGRRVVRWVIEQFLTNGCLERAAPPQNEGRDLLQRAPTLRTASIILDQLNDAFAREVQQLLDLLTTDPTSAAEPIRRLAQLGGTVGRHLVEPWKVVVAGAPNVGKSSLINALAGYQRSVVSEVAGTTRDVVSVRVAFAGWPVELIDTAGLRDAEGLEAEGIARAHEALRTANRLVWVTDVTDANAHVPDFGNDLPVVIANKCDQLATCDPNALPHLDGTVKALPVSAKTGAGLPELIATLIANFPDLPGGAAVPYTPRLIELVAAADASMRDTKCVDAEQFLREVLAVEQGERPV